MESPAQLARKFIRMITASQDLCLEIILDCLSESRKRRHMANSALRDHVGELSYSGSPVQAVSLVSNDLAQAANNNSVPSATTTH